jgi:hypothetical protein
MEEQAKIAAASLVTLRPMQGENAEDFRLRIVQRQEFIAATSNVVAIPRNIIEQWEKDNPDEGKEERS